jgi:prepilin-type N-terminal cleavage/methylation domain-containing protein
MIRGAGRRKGFTMTELAVVVVLFIIIATMAAPQFFNSISDSKTQMAAQQAKSALLFARQASITLRDRMAVVAQVGWDRIEVRNAETNDALVKVFRLPGGTSVRPGGTLNATFHPRGLCTPTGSVIVGDDDRAYRVVVNMTTRVRIEQYNADAENVGG